MWGGHSATCISPLIGITGMMKNSVINRIPFFRRNAATFPQVPQRMNSDVNSEPQKNTLVPMISTVADTLARGGICGKYWNELSRPNWPPNWPQDS